MNGIVSSRRIVDVSNALTDEQKAELGGSKRWVAKEPLGTCCECGRDDEPDPDFEPYWQFTAHSFFVEDKVLSEARKGRDSKAVLEVVRHLFDSGFRLERRADDSIVIDMSIAINLLEADKSPLTTFLSQLKKSS